MGRQRKRYTYEQLAKILKCSIGTLKLYLCRAEFNHILKIRVKEKKINKDSTTKEYWQTYLENITPQDILSLEQLTGIRKFRGWHEL